MDFVAPELKNVNNCWSGSNSVEFYTLGIVGEEQQYRSQYFTNFAFLTHRYSRTPEITSKYDITEAAATESWIRAMTIDPKNYELVVATQEILNKRNPSNVGLFKFSTTYSLEQINTHAAEYAEVRKWNALNKLTEEEIKLLKLEREAVHLKLKYAKIPDSDNSLL